jgi:type 1 glutamine amidotransferase
MEMIGRSQKIDVKKLRKGEKFNKMEKLKVLVVVDYVPHIEIMRKFLQDASFEVEITEDRDSLLKERIAQYDVCLDYMHGGALKPEQTQGLIDFVAGGKALVGVHSAAVDKKSLAFIDLLGGKYIGHEEYHETTVTIVDAEHPITQGMSDFSIIDELYKLEYNPEPLHVLIEGVAEGTTYPVCWTRQYGKGRVVFFSLGHGPESFENKDFQKIVIRSIQWAAGQI